MRWRRRSWRLWGEGNMAIDVWDTRTFDNELLGALDDHKLLIQHYFSTSRQQMMEREASDHRGVYPENPFGSDYLRFVEAVGGLMSERAIRAWHYTRMTDDEVAEMCTKGIYVSTLDSIRRRLDTQVALGTLVQNAADRIFAASPFQGQQHAARTGKFWMTSHPVKPSCTGVAGLLSHWGGESTYFWLGDQQLIDVLIAIGRPRILEIVVPMEATTRCHSAAEACVATFARKLGCQPDKNKFDLYATRALNSDSILTVHTEGDASFIDMGQDFPVGYTDPE
jgi:hypothetical protein